MSYTFKVYDGGKLIDTVFDQESCPHEVKRSLINHDGYSETITVRRCWKVWYIVQGHYGYHGWEDECPEETLKEARARMREYRENMPGYRHRMIKRREQV